MGTGTLLFQGAMARIPTDVLEAARLDGCRVGSELIHIVFPLILPTVSTQIMLLMTGLFNASGPILLLTNGEHETTTIAFWIFYEVKFNGSLNNVSAAGFVKTDKPYYDHWVNGYHFVIMGTEGRGDASAPVVSEEQWAWLEETLNDPENGNNPVFLVVHNPLIGTVTLSDKYHIGTHNDARLKEILKDHKNVIMLSGHNHNGVIDEKALVSNEWGIRSIFPPTGRTTFPIRKALTAPALRYTKTAP